MISRRLVRLANDVRDYGSGEAAATDVIDMIENLLSVPILSEDPIYAWPRKAHGEPSVAASNRNEIGIDVLDRSELIAEFCETADPSSSTSIF